MFYNLYNLNYGQWTGVCCNWLPGPSSGFTGVQWLPRAGCLSLRDGVPYPFSVEVMVVQ